MLRLSIRTRLHPRHRDPWWDAGARVSPPIGGCAAFPADKPWNRDVSCDAVDADSDQYIASINQGAEFLHADFGSNPDWGIPYSTVPGLILIGALPSSSSCSSTTPSRHDSDAGRSCRARSNGRKIAAHAESRGKSAFLGGWN